MFPKENFHQCKCNDFFHKNICIPDYIDSNEKAKTNNFLTKEALSSSPNNNKFNNQFFFLGYILMISALGGMNFDVFELITKIPLSKIGNPCCLFHYFISLEKSNKKYKISKFINEQRFSKYFIEFLCKTLSFENNTFFTLYQNSIYSHPWLKSHLNFDLYSNIKLNLSEIIRLVRESKKKSKTKNEKKLEYVLNNISIILANNKNNISMNHPLLTDINSKEELDKFLTSKKSTIKEISNDLGYNVNELLVLTKNHILNN
jgi:hypothetical protein